jgi:hypothetical protein
MAIRRPRASGLACPSKRAGPALSLRRKLTVRDVDVCRLPPEEILAEANSGFCGMFPVGTRDPSRAWTPEEGCWLRRLAEDGRDTVLVAPNLARQFGKHHPITMEILESSPFS